jgi:hypothetical protein
VANALYPNFKEHLLKGDIDLDLGTVTCYLVDLLDYTYAATHDLIADLPVGARVSSASVPTIVITDGNVDGGNFTFSSVTGDPSEALVLSWNNGGSEYLVAYYDTGVTGLPVTPNSGDINVTVDGSGLFDL